MITPCTAQTIAGKILDDTTIFARKSLRKQNKRYSTPLMNCCRVPKEDRDQRFTPMGPYECHRYQTILSATLNKASKRQCCPPIRALLKIFGQWRLKETLPKYRVVSSFYDVFVYFVNSIFLSLSFFLIVQHQ